MRIALTGSSGMIGSAVMRKIAVEGNQVIRLVRGEALGADQRVWSPESDFLDPKSLEGVDAVVHLSGENIAGRWNEEKKERIVNSRVKGTRLIAQTIAKMSNPPKVLVCASAVGYYGSRGDDPLTEESSAGTGFLAEVCRRWEEAATPARQKGLRVVHLRFGVVLSTVGGALAKMLTPFKLGLGGRIGPGTQYMSWIALGDAVSIVQHALSDEQMVGPVNAVAPRAATNLEFTQTLGRVLWRPTIFPMPAFMARLAFGEAADELLLTSQRVEPVKLRNRGYVYRHPELESALRSIVMDSE